MEPQSKGIAALRWLGFLPGAFLCAWLACSLIFFGNNLFASMIGINPGDFLFRLFIIAWSNGVMGATFVYAGARIAPDSRKVVAYVLALIAVLIAGFIAFPVIAQQNWWAIVEIIAMSGGAGVIAYQVAEGKIDLDTHRLT